MLIGKFENQTINPHGKLIKNAEVLKRLIQIMIGNFQFEGISL